MRVATTLAGAALLTASALPAQQPAVCRAQPGAPLGADSIRPFVHMLLVEPDAAARVAAAESLGRATSPGTPDDHTPRAAADKDPRLALAIALSDTDDRVRTAAACALGVNGDARALPALDMRARTAGGPLRAAVAWAATRIRARSAAPVLVRNATVISGTGAAPRPHTSVLVEGDVITRIGPADSIAVPDNARIIDATGLWLTPGLWDMHVHLGKAGGAALPLLVGAGVTAVRDMGGDVTHLLVLRHRIARGEIVGPRIVFAGPMLEAPATLERFTRMQTLEPYTRTRVPVATPADARRLVDSIAALGVDFIKIRETPDLDTYRAIVAAARANRLPVAGHAPFSMDPLHGAALGLTTFEHASYPYPLDTVPASRARLLRAFRDGGTAIVPTMVAWSASLMEPDSVRTLVADATGARDARRALISDTLAQEWSYDVAEKTRLSDASLRGWCGFVNRTLRDLRAMSDAGVPILPGTDLAAFGLMPGWSLHEELELLVRGGVLTPAQALRAATGLAARHAGRGDVVGTIEVGRRADLLLLRGDPTADISALRQLDAVILSGRLLDAERLAALRGGVPLDWRGGIELLPRVDAAGCAVLRAD